MSAQRDSFPVADLDRRFYACALDRLIAWGICGAVGYLAWRFLLDDDQVVAGLVVIAATIALVSFVYAVLLGVAGISPGKALVGMRVVREVDGQPIGLVQAVVRTGVLGLLTLPTLGLGLATLAWTAVTDPAGRRRGGHDRLTGAVVVDVRRAPERAEQAREMPRPMVNLTAMRLIPAPAEVPPPRAPMGPRPVSPPPCAAPAWRVTFDTGETFVVAGLALVGRSPEPRDGEPVSHLVPLRSSDLSLSKTHAQFQVVPDGALVVMDRDSTNGSIVVRQGVSKVLTGGRPSTLLDGDTVRFGDRSMSVTVTVDT